MTGSDWVGDAVVAMGKADDLATSFLIGIGPAAREEYAGGPPLDVGEGEGGEPVRGQVAAVTQQDDGGMQRRVGCPPPMGARLLEQHHARDPDVHSWLE